MSSTVDPRLLAGELDQRAKVLVELATFAGETSPVRTPERLRSDLMLEAGRLQGMALALRSMTPARGV